MNKNILLWCRTQLFPKISQIQQQSSLFVLQRHFCSEKRHDDESNERDGDQGLSEKLVKVAVIGVPNAGKSTFINNLINHRVCPTSRKVHTTRSFSKAIYNKKDTQFVLFDTPGLVDQQGMKKHNLEQSFISSCRHSIQNSNLIAVIHDVSNSYTRNQLDATVLDTLGAYPKVPSILILNKVDTLKSKRILLDLARLLTENTLECKDRQFKPWKHGSANYLNEISRPVKYKIEKSVGWPNFSEIFMVSALNGNGLHKVLKFIQSYSQPKEWEHKAGEFTDQTPENLIVDTVRARLLDFLNQELPYKLKCELEFYDVMDGKIIASVNVICPNQRIEALVCGINDGKLRQITELVTSDLIATFAKPITLTISTSYLKLKSEANGK